MIARRKSHSALAIVFICFCALLGPAPAAARDKYEPAPAVGRRRRQHAQPRRVLVVAANPLDELFFR
jgi:hypothetical protein